MTDITFLSVEPIWVEYLKHPSQTRSGWDWVADEIAQTIQTHDRVLIESLGAGEVFVRFYQALRQQYPVKLIKVETELETCVERVKHRDRANHIPVTEAQVRAYNQMAATVQYDWDQAIANNGPASDADILQAIQSLL